LSTVQQSRKIRVLVYKKCKVPDLYGNPQKRGICVRPLIRTPKKPCSAKRKILRIKYTKNPKSVVCHVPGEGHNIKGFAEILIHGHRVKDLPGVKYRVVRGWKKKNYSEIKKRARSKYGVQKAYLGETFYLRKRQFWDVVDSVTGLNIRVRGIGLSTKRNTVAS